MLYVVWLIVFGGLYVWYDPVQTISFDSLSALVKALAIAGFWLAACVRVGSRVSKLVHQETHWDTSLLIGVGCFGLSCLLLISLGLFAFWPTFILAIVFVVFGSGVSFPVLPRVGWSIIGFASLWGIVDAWGPIIDSDAIYYHAALPKQLWLHQELIGGVFHPNGSRPLILHLPFGVLYGWGGETGLAFFHLFLSMALLLSVVERGEGISPRAGVWASLLLVGSWSFIHEISVVANNIPVGFACWLAFVLCRENKYTLAALIAGIGLSIKFTAIGVLFGLWWFLVNGVGSRLRVVLICACLVLVWPIRNVIEGVHPFFPYMGWAGEFPFQYLEKYGAGRDIYAMLQLPWNVVVTSEIEDFRFLGRLNPLFLGALPLALVSCWKDSSQRRILGVIIVFCVFWAIGPHWIRHLLPGLAIVAVWLGIALASSSSRAVFWAALFCWGGGLLANWGPLVQQLSHRLPVALGQVDAETYRTEKVPGWKTIRWADKKLPEDAKIAILFSWAGLATDRQYLFSSIEDHVPIRYWVSHHREKSLALLREEGITHLIVGPHLFLHKSYWFLSKDEFTNQFVEPIDILEELLLQEAELIQQFSKYKVYRLVQKTIDNVETSNKP